MFNLEFKDNKSIVIVEEDSIPMLCGLTKGEDFALSISIKVYKNNKGKIGKLNSSYSKTWFTSCTSGAFKKFIIKFLEDVNYRGKHKLSSISWIDNYAISEDEIKYIESSIKQNKKVICCTVKKEKEISSDVPLNTELSNEDLKYEAVSFLISDSELEDLKAVFSNKDELILAICEIIKGSSVDEVIKKMTGELVTA